MKLSRFSSSSYQTYSSSLRTYQQVYLTYQWSFPDISAQPQKYQHSHPVCTATAQPLAQPQRTAFSTAFSTASRSPFFKSITPFPIISVDQEPHSYQDQQPPLHYKQVFGTETSWVWYNCWLDPSKTLLKDIYPPSANSTGPRARKYETPPPCRVDSPVLWLINQPAYS